MRRNCSVTTILSSWHNYNKSSQLYLVGMCENQNETVKVRRTGRVSPTETAVRSRKLRATHVYGGPAGLGGAGVTLHPRSVHP